METFRFYLIILIIFVLYFFPDEELMSFKCNHHSKECIEILYRNGLISHYSMNILKKIQEIYGVANTRYSLIRHIGCIKYDIQVICFGNHDIMLNVLTSLQDIGYNVNFKTILSNLEIDFYMFSFIIPASGMINNIDYLDLYYSVENDILVYRVYLVEKMNLTKHRVIYSCNTFWESILTFSSLSKSINNSKITFDLFNHFFNNCIHNKQCKIEILNGKDLIVEFTVPSDTLKNFDKINLLHKINKPINIRYKYNNSIEIISIEGFF